MTKAKEPSGRLIALVGTDIDDKRYEAGQALSGDLTDSQRKYLIEEGYAVEAEKLPVDIKEAIERGAATPHSVESRLDTKEE